MSGYEGKRLPSQERLIKKLQREVLLNPARALKEPRPP